MRLYPEVMPEGQQTVLRQVGSFATKRGFVLTGGTALAIQLGHRRSVDLDWFTEGEISDGLSLAAELRDAGVDFEVTDTARGTLHGQADGVQVSFLEYRYPALEAPLDWPDYGCRLAAPEDLACMKLSAIVNRGARKDFIDLYSLGGERMSLHSMLALYRRKYQLADLGHVLMSLTYFDDAEAEEMPVMLWDTGWAEIKDTIEGWVRSYVELKATS